MSHGAVQDPAELTHFFIAEGKPSDKLINSVRVPQERC